MTTNKIIPIFKQDKGESPFPASFTPPDEDPLHSLGKSSSPYPRPAPLSDPALSAKIASGYTLIDEYYSRLQNLAHINIRPQQIQLSKRVFEGFMRKIPSFNQAPTGTGKTLAYLVGAIAASQCSLVSNPQKTQNNDNDNETENPKKTKKTSPPIVIATATVTLLDQIIHKDIPLLLKANIPLSASSIKGRQRYYCPNSANIIAEELRGLDPQLSLLNQDPSESHQHVDEFERQRHIQQFHHHFSNGWNGEQETYSGPTKYWPDVRAHQDTCLQSACDFYDQCPFYKARKQMNIVDILITTHDFVLQDLSMKKTDSSQSLLREEYLLVIDEAHQFPLKAHKLGSSAITPLALIEKLHAMRAVSELILQYPKLRVLLEKQEIRFNDFEISHIQRHLSELHSILNDIYSECHKQVPHTLKKELDRPQLKRLRNDMIIALNSKLKTLKNTAKLCARITAPDLLQPAQKLAALITPLLTIFQDISTQINLTHQNPQKPSITTELLSNPLSPYASKPNSTTSFEHAINAFDSTVTDSIYPKLRQYILGAPPEASISQTRYSELITALGNASPLPISQRLIKHMLDKLIDEHKNFCAVSWLDASTCPEGVDPASFQPQLSLYGESLAGTQRLRELLWDQASITPAFLSATLGNINAFKASTGLPQDRESFTKNLRHIFDYSQHEMHIVDTLYTPKYDQRTNFLKELFREIPLCVNPLEATLILCPNRKILATVQRALLSCTSIDPSSVLVQGSAGLQSLIDTHKQRIDRGLGSILCGVESLCEGLDLQGNYCTHVIITAIPFSSTTSPVEQEWQQILQDDYFSQRLLPQTLIKLVQMIGRLIRRESDYGKITIFDRRLLDRWAQKEVLPLLPPFNRSTIQPPSTLTHNPPAPSLTNQPPQYPHHTTPVAPPSDPANASPTPPCTPSTPADCGSPLKDPPILLHDLTRAAANHPPDRQPTAQSPLSSKDRLSPSSSSKDAHHAA